VEKEIIIKTMDDHLELSDSDFEEQFKNCTLIPDLFTHEAHLRLAWIHVSRYGQEIAAEHLCFQIAKFDKTFDTGTKFHKTLTIASIKIIANYIQKSFSDDFEEFLEEFPSLNYNFKEIISAHYSYNIFEHPTARVEYLEPDLEPF